MSSLSHRSPRLSWTSVRSSFRKSFSSSSSGSPPSPSSDEASNSQGHHRRRSGLLERFIEANTQEGRVGRYEREEERSHRPLKNEFLAIVDAHRHCSACQDHQEALARGLEIVHLLPPQQIPYVAGSWLSHCFRSSAEDALASGDPETALREARTAASVSRRLSPFLDPESIRSNTGRIAQDLYNVSRSHYGLEQYEQALDASNEAIHILKPEDVAGVLLQGVNVTEMFILASLCYQRLDGVHAAWRPIRQAQELFKQAAVAEQEGNWVEWELLYARHLEMLGKRIAELDKAIEVDS